jgi:hypothetical protein
MNCLKYPQLEEHYYFLLLYKTYTSFT